MIAISLKQRINTHTYLSIYLSIDLLLRSLITYSKVDPSKAKTISVHLMSPEAVWRIFLGVIWCHLGAPGGHVEVVLRPPGSILTTWRPPGTPTGYRETKRTDLGSPGTPKWSPGHPLWSTFLTFER